MKNQEYQKLDALSFSTLKWFAVSPAHYRAVRDGLRTTESDELFTLVHMTVLEPDIVERETFIVGDRRTKEGKAQYQTALDSGKLPVKEAELTTAWRVASAVKNHKFANLLTSLGKNEQSFRTKHPHFSFDVKCRPDALLPEQKIIADLKSFDCLTLDNIQRQIVSKKYHWQAAFYVDAIKIVTGEDYQFCHVWVETKEPFGVRVTRVPEAVLDKAREEYYHLFLAFDECFKSDRWPSYPESIDDVGLPSWAWGKSEI